MAREPGRGTQTRQQPWANGWRAVGFVVIALLLAAIFGITGNGPLAFMQRSAGSSSSDATVNSGNSRSTTAGRPTFVTRSYQVGDCVDWDQDSAAGPRSTHVVPCTASHLVEIAGRLDVGRRFDHYPTQAEWQVVFAHDCLPAVEALLGRPLDPEGRFTLSGLIPVPQSWDSRNHAVWCVAELTPGHATSPGSDLVAFTGKVEGASQTRTARIGTCFTNASPYAVPCRRPHAYEVTGDVNLSGLTSNPPPAADDRAWDKLVGRQCAAIARSYMHRALGADESSGWLRLLPQSWAAGRRVIECTVQRRGASNPAALYAGSLRD